MVMWAQEQEETTKKQQQGAEPAKSSGPDSEHLNKQAGYPEASSAQRNQSIVGAAAGDPPAASEADVRATLEEYVAILNGHNDTAAIETLFPSKAALIEKSWKDKPMTGDRDMFTFHSMSNLQIQVVGRKASATAHMKLQLSVPDSKHPEQPKLYRDTPPIETTFSWELEQGADNKWRIQSESTPEQRAYEEKEREKEGKKEAKKHR
jgi:hypothetical protein